MKWRCTFLSFVLLLICMFGICLADPEQAQAASTPDFTTPATVIPVTEEVLSSLIDSRADGNTPITETIGGVQKTYTPIRETYALQDRQWQGTPTVACLGNRIWCAWQTGGNSEPRIFNYIVIAYSDDGGITWVDPFLIIDHAGEEKGVYVTCPSFWVNSKGNLCMNYVQYGTWTVEFFAADAEDISDVTWSQPYKFSNSRMAKAPTKVVDGEGTQWLMYASESEAGDSHQGVTRIYASSDDGQSWTLRSVIPSAYATKRTCAESNLVQTSDGTLIVASRIEEGYANGMEVSYSYDYGLTWTQFEGNLEEPFIGPGSKFHLELLPSGNLLMVNHATTSTRENLKVYLSEDNGKTWPYSMTLDARSDVSYPYAFANGDYIYIAWDKGRYIEKEIRVSVLTEADIKAGKVVSEGSATMLKASKLNPEYKEIVQIKTEFEKNLSFVKGTEADEIRNQLPGTVVVVDNEGTEYSLTGIWRCKGYDANSSQIQIFVLDAELPMQLADNYGLLEVSVTLTDASEGCESSIGTYSMICLAGAIIAAAYVMVRNKKVRGNLI